MSSQTARTTAAAAFAAALSVTASAVAQPVAGPGFTLDPIVVTPTGRPEPATEAGSAVTVIGEAEIRRSRQYSTIDVLRRVPGLTATQSGGFGSESVVRLRGAESGQVQVRLDGVELNDPSSAAGDFNFAGLLTTGIERIEVLRGPQSALYGSDAMGGVISLTTGVGEGPPSGRLTGEYGSFDTIRGSGTIAGSFGRLAYGLNAAGLTTNGFSRRDEDFGFTEDDSTQAVNLTGRATADLTPTLSAELAGGYIRNNAELDIAAAEERIGETTLDLGYGRFSLEHAGLDGALITRASFSASNTDREVVEPGRTSLFTGRRFEGDLRAEYALGERWTLIGGAGVEEEQGEGEDVGGPDPGQRFDEALTTVFGFGLVRVEPLDGLVLTASGRVDDFEAGGTEPTWRVTGAYAMPETGTTLRASVGTAARAPTIFQLFDSFTIDFGGFTFVTEPNPDLETETSLGVDAGIEQALFDNRLTLSATGFFNDFENLIQFSGSRFENVAEARTWGIELAVSAAPVDWLLWDVSYTFLETEDRTTGLELRRRPQHSLTSIIDIQPTEDLSLVGEIRYVGEQFNDSDNDDRLDPYTVVNVTASYSLTDNLIAFARVENLFDEDYQEALGFGTAGISGFGGLSLTF
ncbi:MAG: TonB-dependent receptor [Alphaproteobacteria bacterium]|jgi:vitamin B12 transporter|nr:TonB-dependent receptor [Alphaproteobacteria bacterium]